jgi:predicted phosphodiesterase
LQPVPVPPLVGSIVAAPLIRIISDLHFGDRASSVHELARLAPLAADASELVLNGDTLETRPGPKPDRTIQLQETLRAFVQSCPVNVRLITGNHDPDISTAHLHELADSSVLITHGDIAFDDIVPWSQDAPLAAQLVAQARRRTTDSSLDSLLAVHRIAAAAIPQRHQSENRRWHYLQGIVQDTIWPVGRIPRILRAWAELPARMARIARTHRPQARFIVVGHTHRPGYWRQPDGLLVLNTGSFCLPLGARVVEVAADHLTLRAVAARGGEFHPGERLAEFALAPA